MSRENVGAKNKHKCYLKNDLTPGPLCSSIHMFIHSLHIYSLFQNDNALLYHVSFLKLILRKKFKTDASKALKNVSEHKFSSYYWTSIRADIKAQNLELSFQLSECPSFKLARSKPFGVSFEIQILIYNFTRYFKTLVFTFDIIQGKA